MVHQHPSRVKVHTTNTRPSRIQPKPELSCDPFLGGRPLGLVGASLTLVWLNIITATSHSACVYLGWPEPFFTEFDSKLVSFTRLIVRVICVHTLSLKALHKLQRFAHRRSGTSQAERARALVEQVNRRRLA